MGFLKSAFTASCRIHSRAITLKRLTAAAGPTLYSGARATPSNYFRYLAGPSQTVVTGSEFIIPVSTLTGTMTQLLSFPGVPTEGTFTIGYGPDSSTLIDTATDTAVEIQVAVRAINPVLARVTVTGDYTTGFLFTMIDIQSPLLLTYTPSDLHVGTLVLPSLSGGKSYKLALIGDLGITAPGGIVSAWEDQSGNGYIATPASGAPTVAPAYDNGHDAVYIDSGQALSIPGFSLSTSFTAFALTDIDDSGSWGFFLEHSQVSDANPGFMLNLSPGGDANLIGIHRDTADIHYVSNVNDLVKTRSLVVIGYDASTQTFRGIQDGVDLSFGGDTGAPTTVESVVTDSLNIGRRNGGADPSTQAKVSAIIIVEGFLTQTEIDDVTATLTDYFSVAPGVTTEPPNVDNTLVTLAESMSVPWSPVILRGDKIIDGSKHLTIKEIIEIPDLGGETMGWRVRVE